MGRQRRGEGDWSAHEGALSTFLLMAHLSNGILGRGERVWGSTGEQDVFGGTRGCESSVASRGTLSSAQPWELGELFSSLHPLSCIYFICSGLSAWWAAPSANLRGCKREVEIISSSVTVSKGWCFGRGRAAGTSMWPWHLASIKIHKREKAQMPQISPRWGFLCQPARSPAGRS